MFTLRYSSQRRTPFISHPRFKAGEFDSFNRWAFVLDRGCTCVLRLCFHPLIGPAEAPSPSNGPAAAMQRCSGSGHVWRQMEPGSVSGLPEMSLTSAARKESGHRRSGITRWNKKKKRSRYETELDSHLPDQEVKESRAAGQKSQTDRQVGAAKGGG